MEAFFTAREKALRAGLRERLWGRRSVSGAAGVPAESLLEGLIDDSSGPALFERALLLEEISLTCPRLGREMFQRMSPTTGGMVAFAGSALSAAECIGAAAFVLEACYRAALDKNLFQSVLMEAGKIQQDMADLAAGLESVRFEAYRSLRLLDRGETDQGGSELERTSGRAAALKAGILRLASDLLGKTWLRENLPDDSPLDESGAGAVPERSLSRGAAEPNERSDA
jgi:hypothetical protein